MNEIRWKLHNKVFRALCWKHFHLAHTRNDVYSISSTEKSTCRWTSPGSLATPVSTWMPRNVNSLSHLQLVHFKHMFTTQFTSVDKHKLREYWGSTRTILQWTWILRSMNLGKLEVVKQEMARVKMDILRISELK